MSDTKVALVTGSGKRRVGWHVAEALARKGYAVAVHYHVSAVEAGETVRHLQSLGIAAAAFPADLTDADAVRALFRGVVNTFGRLDVLVNCAAIWYARRLEDATASEVRQFFDVNALGTFLCCQQAGMIMVGQPEGGCIITMGDWAVARPYLNHAAYFASKGAIPAITTVLAVELAQRNPRVRVNCILPGPVMLPPTTPAAERKRVIDATLLKREGRPENVAQAALALIENDFVTGACLTVDGGRTIYATDHI